MLAVAIATRLGEISTPTALALYFSTAAISTRPSPDPRSNTVSPGLIFASTSMRSTTRVGEATYGANLLAYREFCAFTGPAARAASTTAIANGQRIRTYSVARMDNRE